MFINIVTFTVQHTDPPGTFLLLMAAFRYPHRTRQNSGPDQIILVLKIRTEPVRSWCCLHIQAKFWSAAAINNSGPISVL